jgi:hypothetical protein
VRPPPGRWRYLPLRGAVRLASGQWQVGVRGLPSSDPGGAGVTVTDNRPAVAPTSLHWSRLPRVTEVPYPLGVCESCGHTAYRVLVKWAYQVSPGFRVCLDCARVSRR